jgi:hypothetical protein
MRRMGSAIRLMESRRACTAYPLANPQHPAVACLGVKVLRRRPCARSGVIDFGAMFAGDPAWDLAAAWVILPAGAASRFFDVYAQADEGTIRRARGLAALKSLFLMLMGQNGDRGLPGGKPTWGPAGRAALDRVLRDGLT